MSDRPDRLQEIRERLEAATPGTWCWINAKHDEGRLGRLFSSDGGMVLDTPDFCYGKLTDARFIAHAPSDIRWLVEEIERLRKEIFWRNAAAGPG